MNEHDGLPGLAFLSACWHWVDEFIVILSIPMLVFGATITVVDLLTDGATTLSWPWLVVAWAISQGLGIEANVSGSIHKAKAAYERGAWVVMLLYILLCFALGAVIVVAGYVYSYHQTRGIPIQQSLSDLGIDPATWVMSRSVLAFVLIAVSVLTRFTGKKPDVASQAQKLREDIELAPLRAKAEEAKAQQRAAKMIGARTVAAALVKGAHAPTTQPAVPADPYPANETPWGPVPWGAPLTPPAGFQQAQNSIHLVPNPPTRTPRKRAPKRKPRGSANWETAAREAWEQGARTVGQMEARVAGMSHTAAQYWVGVFKGEERGEERARQEA